MEAEPIKIRPPRRGTVFGDPDLVDRVKPVWCPDWNYGGERLNRNDLVEGPIMLVTDSNKLRVDLADVLLGWPAQRRIYVVQISVDGAQHGELLQLFEEHYTFDPTGLIPHLDWIKNQTPTDRWWHLLAKHSKWLSLHPSYGEELNGLVHGICLNAMRLCGVGDNLHEIFDMDDIVQAAYTITRYHDAALDELGNLIYSGARQHEAWGDRMDKAFAQLDRWELECQKVK